MFMICSEMSAAAALTETGSPASAPDAASPLLARQLAQLDRLAEAGVEMAEALASQAKGSGPEVVEGDVALAYARVSRAVRMAVMLQSRLRDGARTEATADTARADNRPDLENMRKTRVQRIVARVFDDAHPEADQEQFEHIGADARERLDDDDLYGDVLSRPISELVAQVCHDLGLEPDWASLAHEPWAQREIESGEVGRPLAGRVLPCERQRTGQVAQRAGGGIPPPPPFELQT
jgi:hypothetical protein